MSDWNSRDLEDWDWAYGLGTPIKCRIVTQPETAFQVFIGLSKAHWNEPGKRLVDIVIQIRHVDTVDTFEAGKNVTFARMFPAKSNAKGEICVIVAPNEQTRDGSPAVCRILLFDGTVALDVAKIVANEEPTPRVTVNCGPPRTLTEEQLHNRGKSFSKKSSVPQPLPSYRETKPKLPPPIYDENPDYVACYWKAWELAFHHFRQPQASSPVVRTSSFSRWS